MNEHIVSIIVPVYKVEAYLNACVNSLICQTKAQIEIILVDDGSPDSCPQMCEEWAKKDSRIRVIHQKNGGLSASRNAGIDAARGEWLIFVDSDDTVHPQMAELLLNAVLQEPQSDIAICGIIWCEKPLLKWPMYIKETACCRLTGKELWERFYSKDNVDFVVAWNKLYRKSLFREIRYPVGRIHEDEFTTYKLLAKADGIAYLQADMYGYLQRSGSITHEAGEKRMADVVDSLEERLRFMKESYPDTVYWKELHWDAGAMDELLQKRQLSKKNYQKVMRARRKLFWLEYPQLSAKEKRGGIFHYTLPRLYACYQAVKKHFHKNET